MGKTGTMQTKLTFDNKRHTRSAESETEPETEHREGTAEGGDDLRSILLEVQSSLKTIDAKIDKLMD